MAVSNSKRMLIRLSYQCSPSYYEGICSWCILGNFTEQSRCLVCICIQYRLHEVFLFSFPVRGFLTLSPQLSLPQRLPFIFSFPEASRLERGILGTVNMRAPNYKTKRRLIVSTLSFIECTSLHFGVKNAMQSCSFRNSIFARCSILSAKF